MKKGKAGKTEICKTNIRDKKSNHREALLASSDERPVRTNRTRACTYRQSGRGLKVRTQRG